MLLAEKGAHCEQVPVNVLNGEPRQLEHDGFRIIETGAIAPYLD